MKENILKIQDMETKVKQLIGELRGIIDDEEEDTEYGHIHADEILLKIIAEYGHPEVKEIFDAIGKWYA